MKYIYVNVQRLALMHAVAVWLVVLTANLALAQRTDFEPGTLRIKVSEELAQRLETSRMTRSADNVLLTGVQSLDLANIRYKVSSFQRVFRSAGKFEAKHRRYGLHRWYEIRMDKSSPVAEALASYGAIEQIERAEPSYSKKIIGSDKPGFGPIRVSEKELKAPLIGLANDPLLASQWHYNNTGQAGGTPDSDISLFQAWTIETGTPNVVVAVTDGGAQVNHPDLAANMWVNTDEIPGNDIDDDNNGFVDDYNGYGFGDNTGEIAPDDHGSHTSGTIAAVTNNAIGVAGVAGGSGTGDGARIMTLAAFGGTANGGFAETYVYGADNGAVISQNSWGYTFPDVFEQAVLDGIDYFIAEAGKDENGNQVGPMRGGIVIFAAGNDDDDGNWYPGFYDKTLAVGGLTNQDKKAWYSNYGTWVDMSAPGGETFVADDPHGVLSTIAGSQYAFFQGTSMACPHVSGVAALIVSKFGGDGFTPEMLRGRLTQLVDDVDAADPPFAGLLGSGRLNAFKALQSDDGDAPAAITDLAATGATITSVTLAWTAPADPGNGSASVYDIRYSTAPITGANFDAATAVANPPAPLSAGSVQSYTVTALAGGTQYYFAIKAADFFGNYSAISNVVAQATNFPPEITVFPDTISAQLQSTQSTTRSLTIVNSGAGVLSFQFDSLASGDFATPSPASGTVAAFDTLVVTVTIDASELLPGFYEQDLIVASNDPTDPSLVIPVLLDVISNGKPIASVAPDTLNFGPVFESGSKTLEVTVHNEGAEVLHITSVTSSASEFTTGFTDTLDVAPFDDVVIAVTYQPSGLGADSGTLSIATNDSLNAVLTVYMMGEGVPAPDLEVTPSSLSAQLSTGRTETQTLTLRNTGGSDLQFSVEVTTATVTALATEQTITIPSGEIQQSSAQQKNSATNGYPAQVRLRSEAQMAAEAKVLVLTPDNDVNDIASILDAFSDVDADIFPKASLPSITLADLAGYDIVFTTNNTQWLQAGAVDPGVIGDLLADYIDAGGKVISNQFTYSYDAWKMEGRFIDEQYGPFIPSTTDAQINVTLGDILAPTHAVMQGVSTLTYSGFVQNVTLAPGAVALAEWSDGQLFLAANTNVVALNMLPSLGNGGPLQFSGDLPLIYHNAIRYLSGPGFVQVTPAQGVIAAGAQLDLDVTFDATGLDSGVYEASIDIATNVPGQGTVSVPATLTVLGPEFAVSPDSLQAELEKDQTLTQVLILSNNGPDDQTFTVDVEGVGASAAVAMIQRMLPAEAAARTAAADPAEKIQRNASQRVSADLASEAAHDTGRPDAGNFTLRSALAVPASATQYATDFENFSLADVNGQQGWFGQFGNWRIEADNAYSGSQHFRGLSDGLGLSAAASPSVPIGTEEKSTTSMKLNIQGSGTTWQIIPQSPSAALVNTRIQFAPNGTVSALVSNGSGGAVFSSFATTPSGYFELAIEVDRDSSYFHVYFDGARVFTGQGFTGDIEEVVVLSGMEVAGPTLDLDDFKIIDGEKTSGVSFLNVSPLSGNLPSGSSVELVVTFNSNDLDFGTYHANINIKVASTRFTVPASLRVFGDPEIDVDPTFLKATVDYREDTTKILTISNTGGNPLNYSLQVIGAATSGEPMLAVTKAKQSQRVVNDKTREKIERDERHSPVANQSPSTLQLLTGTALLQEDFEDASFPPAGWQVVDHEGTGLVWDFAAAYGEDNYAGTGEAATASSDAAGEVEFDTELITPAISTAGFKNIAVQYNVNYQNYLSLDFLDLDIQVDGGAWINVLRWNEDHGSLRGTGVSVTAALASYIGNGSSFRLRWHYYDPNTGDFDWYAQVDDVVIYGDPRAWLTVSPASGTIPVQGTADVEAHFDAADVGAGSYVAGILVSSNAAEDPLVGVVAQLIVRSPAVMSVTPASLYQELLVDEQATQTITIANSGASMLKYAFGNTPVPTAVAAVPQERRETSPRTTPSTERVDLADVKAISSGYTLTASTPLYVTGFEDFAPGDINGQKGWVGQFSNWDIEAENPFEGSQHIRSISDGLGATRAFSPVVAIGSDPTSSASVRLDVETGVTWQVVPQSPSATFVNTRIQIAANGTLSALVKDAGGNAVFAPIAATLPSGYFELRIDVNRATSVFTVFFDGEEVFTGQGFAGNIEQLVLFSAMEVSGPVMDIDNVAIFDGPAQAPWLTYGPRSGIVLPGESATITVNFNAADLEAGFYTDTLKLSSNDPAHAHTDIPVTMKVLVNTPPVLAAINPLTVRELSAADVSFTATDIDNEPVTVVLEEDLAFITALSTSNGNASYRIKPLPGDAGTYDLNVKATDARGKSDAKVFQLTVTPYGVVSFTLFNTRTNLPVTTFTDTVEIDMTQPDFSKLTFRANTDPSAVGSVRFRLDNQNANTDNTAPYTLNTLSTYALLLLGCEDHTLTATAYTQKNGGGNAGRSLTAVVRIVNPARVTDLDVVKQNGSKLADLTNGTVIDVSKTAYKKINIKANTLSGKVKSVVFTLNGVAYRTDNLAPYQLGGVGSIIDLPWPAVPGSYQLTATPYSEIYGLGIAGQPLTVSFTVVNGVAAASARSRGPEEGEELKISEESPDSFLNIYPVPVRDELHIELHEKTPMHVGVSIHNAQGMEIFADDGGSDKFRSYSVSTGKLGMRAGVYFLQVRYEDGRREVKKVLKE